MREDGETENREADDDAMAWVAGGEEQVETGKGEEDSEEFRPRIGGVLEKHRVEEEQAGGECRGGGTAAEGACEEQGRKKGECTEEQHEHLVMREAGARDPKEGGIGEVRERRAAGEDDEAAKCGVVLTFAQEEERALILLLPVAHPQAAIVTRDAGEEGDAGEAEERPRERGLADIGIAGEFEYGVASHDREGDDDEETGGEPRVGEAGDERERDAEGEDGEGAGDPDAPGFKRWEPTTGRGEGGATAQDDDGEEENIFEEIPEHGGGQLSGWVRRDRRSDSAKKRRSAAWRAASGRTNVGRPGDR